MSLVYITYHNENIFDVEVDASSNTVRRRSRYQSKHRPFVRQQSQKLNIIDLPDGNKLLTDAPKAKHKTMGCADPTPLEPPCAYLRKRHGVKWRRERDHICPPTGMMPPVPKRPAPKSRTAAQDKPTTPKRELLPRGPHCPQKLTGHKHRLNFIAVNVERIKTAPTKRPPPRYVDTPHGDTHAVLNSGLLPQYICHKNFGKVPCYLHVQKRLLQKVRNQCMRDQHEQMHVNTTCKPGIRQLNVEERSDILEGLKINFAELTKAYQRQPLFTDTIAKKMRKGKLENELRQLEQDIYLMESNPTIYVSEY